MRAIIHVNRHLIAKNRKDGKARPIYAVKRGGSVTYAHGVSVRGRLTFVDPRHEKPLPCGATIYAIADGDVDLVDPVPYSHIKET
jgi:hypothetical protein